MQKKISPKNTEEIVFINAHRKQAWPFRFAFKFLYITAIIFIICPFTDCAEENLHKEILKRVSMVNIDSIGAHLRRLQDFKTRYALSDSCRAAEKYLLSISITVESIQSGMIPFFTKGLLCETYLLLSKVMLIRMQL